MPVGFVSTRDSGGARAVSLSEAIHRGLAPDGGLYVPSRVAERRHDEIEAFLGDAANALGQRHAGHGDVLRAVPEAVEIDDVLVGQRAPADAVQRF